ncbi:hypothetical protein [Chamaesiphon polymorphus]|uniref:Uncharacterized protein n=1 Tax=Chamaesiphon polymorphus CCALA 037 TaxID=2107692 RepID=A0A2T1GIH3_9CYAN|nr:hypothetical protein [Chamaesiphon polymorphus]PSB57537.1 hypothetical protein C7B77_08030 [Chamaesiphon polymorphus CCALA 037]
MKSPEFTPDRSEYIAIFRSLDIASIDTFIDRIGMMSISLLIASAASFRLDRDSNALAAIHFSPSVISS